MNKRALVLASGGLDSTTCLAIALESGFEVTALSFSYGQRHQAELEAVRRVIEHYRIDRHLVVELGIFRSIGGSALTADIAVPRHRSVDELPESIPMTYVPARNLVFLSQAIAVAEALEIRDLFIGVNAVDYSGYPDCRPEFIEQFERTANLATKLGVSADKGFKVHTPLLRLSKAEIVKAAFTHGVPIHLTHSCYDPSPTGESCGQCDSCLLRIKGFVEAGRVDPIRYAAHGPVVQ